MCLAVTCHLHFWQSDRDLLHATAITRGWNWYRNKSQHRKLIPEKSILPPFLPGLEPGTFRSRVRRSNHWAIPAPQDVPRFMLNTRLSTLRRSSIKMDLIQKFRAESTFSSQITYKSTHTWSILAWEFSHFCIIVLNVVDLLSTIPGQLETEGE